MLRDCAIAPSVGARSFHRVGGRSSSLLRHVLGGHERTRGRGNQRRYFSRNHKSSSSQFWQVFLYLTRIAQLITNGSIASVLSRFQLLNHVADLRTAQQELSQMPRQTSHQIQVLEESNAVTHRIRTAIYKRGIWAVTVCRRLQIRLMSCVATGYISASPVIEILLTRLSYVR